MGRPAQPPCDTTRAGSATAPASCGNVTVTGAAPLAAITWAQVTTLRPVTTKPAPIWRPHSILACPRALFTHRPWPRGPSPTS